MIFRKILSSFLIMLSLYNGSSYASANTSFDRKSLFGEKLAKPTLEKLIFLDFLSREPGDSIYKIRFEQFKGWRERDAGYYNFIGERYFNIKIYDEMNKMLNKAVELDHDNPHFLQNLAISYGLIGEHEKAEEYFRSAINKSIEQDMDNRFFFSNAGINYVEWFNQSRDIDFLKEAVYSFILFDYVAGKEGIGMRNARKLYDAIKSAEGESNVDFGSFEDIKSGVIESYLEKRKSLKKKLEVE